MKTNRIAVAVMFFIFGSTFGTWASRIPLIQEKLALNHAELGTLLLALPIGSLCSLPITGWLSTRFRSKNLVLFAVLLSTICLPLIALMPSVGLLSIVLFIFGLSNNLLNISANIQAVAVELAYRKPIMSSFHALFSFGSMIGAAASWAMEQYQVALLPHFSAVWAVFALVALFFQSKLIPQDKKPAQPQPIFAMPDAALLGLGLIAFCVMIGEGAMADWSSIYMKEHLENPEKSSLGFTAFSFAMAAGRFSGDFLTARFGTIKLLKINGIAACLGMLLALLFPYPVFIVLGFILVGLGLSTGVPLVYSLVGRSKTMPTGVALAAVSTVGVTGFLIGPPIIGFLAQLSSLRIAFLFIAILSAFITLLANKAREH
jgi:MFS family permease